MSGIPTLREPQQVVEETGKIQTDRRGLLKGLFAFLGSLVLGSFFYGLYRFMAPGAGTHPPVEVPLGELAPGTAYSLQYGGSPGILIREEDGGLLALSLVCTHLACTVVWNPEKREFHCPCHDALFDAQGHVLSGPPPAPLERWKVEMKGDRVLVGGA